MELLEISLRIIVLAIGGIVSLSFLTAGLSIMRSSKLDYSATREATRDFRSAISGTVPTFRNGGRNIGTSAGMVVNIRSKKVILNGKISDENISNILPAKLVD